MVHLYQEISSGQITTALGEIVEEEEKVERKLDEISERQENIERMVKSISDMPFWKVQQRENPDRLSQSTRLHFQIIWD